MEAFCLVFRVEKKALIPKNEIVTPEHEIVDQFLLYL